jgi:PAS domain S-box-containing protein
MGDELKAVVDSLPGLVWTAHAGGHVDFVNQRWTEFTGLSAENLVGQGWWAAIHPEDLFKLLERWQSTLGSDAPWDASARLRRADGQFQLFRFRAAPVVASSTHAAQWCGIISELSRPYPGLTAVERVMHQELARLSAKEHPAPDAVLDGSKVLLELATSRRPLPEILDGLCCFVEETIQGCFCSVGLMHRRGGFLKFGAAPSLLDSFITSTLDQPVSADSGPCTLSAFSDADVYVPNIEIDEFWQASDWSSIAQTHGIHGFWTSPIRSTSQKVVGVWSVYYHNPQDSEPEYKGLISRIKHLASIAIERAESDEALRRSEAFLAETQRLSQTGGLFWHLSTDELTWSDEVYRIFEVDPSLPPTLELTLTRLHPEDVPAFLEMRLRQMNDVMDFEHDYRLLMPDKSIKYLHVVGHVTRDADDLLVYSAAVQDISERRRSEQILEKLRSELAHMARVTSLGALTASIAHEVSQPLAGIVTNASTCLRMLAVDPPNLTGARETARRTIRDGNRASEVITRLRALFGKKTATSEPVDLNEAAREVIALTLTELQRSNAVVRSELAEELPIVIGDRVQLQQVILNLVLNASDAMREITDRPRQMVIKTEPHEPDHVRLIVRDSGIGIDSQGEDKLFEAFYTTKSGGMGIGLSVSRSIIESHRGRLWAESNRGPGATFAFTIPCNTDMSKHLPLLHA